MISSWAPQAQKPHTYGQNASAAGRAENELGLRVQSRRIPPTLLLVKFCKAMGITPELQLRSRSPLQNFTRPTNGRNPRFSKSLSTWTN